MTKEPTKYVIQEAKIETIDEAVFNWVKNKELSIESFDGFSKVPVFWQTADRAYQVKSDDSIRDGNSSIILPIIYIFREDFKKDPSMRTSYYANLYPQNDEKGGTVTYARRIQQDKTSIFRQNEIHKHGPQFIRRKDPKKTVYQIISAPIPISIEANYKINIKTDKIQHTNTILSSFIKDGNNNVCFPIRSNNGNMYECWLSDYPTKTDEFLEEKERTYETSLNVKVLGYIYNSEKNEEKPQVVVRENVVDVKTPRERSSLQDVNTLTRNSKFREE